ncbi:MAG: hypothetical protein Rubg2KO_25670 [Rubricoccaceae bacterium]
MMTLRCFGVALAMLFTLPHSHAQTLELDAELSTLIPDVDESSVAWGDYTGDGLADLVVTGRTADGTRVGLVFRSDGPDGLMLDEAASALIPDVAFSAVAWGDYTGDGLADLVVTGGTATFDKVARVYRSDGPNGLMLDEAASALVPTVIGGSVAWRDYTGDGLADLVVVGDDFEPVSRVLRSDGPNGLMVDEAASALVPEVLGSVAWGDYTGDGLADLVVTGDSESGKVGSVYRSDGPNGLVEDATASALVIGVGSGSVAWGDYTGDGLADLVVTGEDANGNAFSNLYRSDGEGGLEVDPGLIPLPRLVNSSVAWGDYSGDGLADLGAFGATGDGFFYSLIFRSDGTGSLVGDSGASDLVPVSVFGSVAWGDYTGDGIDDLIITGEDHLGEHVGHVYRGIPAPPANDAFGNVERITAVGTVTGSNVSATVEDGEPEASCQLDAGASVWWNFQSPAKGTITLDFAASTFDTVVSLYAVNAQGATEIACNDDGSGTTSRLEDVEVETDIVYYVRVAGYDGGTGPAQGQVSFEFSFTSAPVAGDALTEAIGPLSPGESVTATNMNATLEAGEPEASCLTSGSTGASVWWWFTAPATGTVTFDFASSDFDTVVSLYPDTNPDLPAATAELACNDDILPGTTVQSRLVDVAVEGGAQYALRVAGYDDGVNGPAEGTVAFAYTFTPAVADEDGAEAALELAVSPNPVASASSVSVTLAEPQDVTVEVVDALGRRVAVLHEGPVSVGASRWRWDAARHPAGVYMVRLRAGDAVRTQRVTVVR